MLIRKRSEVIIRIKLVIRGGGEVEVINIGSEVGFGIIFGIV